MIIASVLPHLRRFGGVRRFLQMGNAFIRAGYEYDLYVLKRLDGEAKDWIGQFKGNIIDGNLPIKADILLVADTSNPKSLKKLEEADCPNKFIVVNAGGELKEGYRKYYGKYPFILTNREFLKDFPDGYVIEGGVDTDFWKPYKINVGYYDQAYKGNSDVKTELGDLEYINLIPVKGLDDEELRKEYLLMDYFVSVEKRGGWSNTAAEALSCGIPVITKGVNTEPFSDRVIKVRSLRDYFVNPMGEFSWDSVAQKILNICEE